MTNSQNSEIPEPLFATEVDFAVHDIAQNLKFNLEWLPYAYGRAFRHFQGDKFYPEVYKGFENYLQARPDNDKKGQCYFVVGKEQIMNFEQTTRHFLKYEIGIVVMVNLKEIDSSSLDTELITQNLISEARNVINHKLVGKPYRVNLSSVEREFRDIFREFTFNEKENYLKAPLQAFRINGEILLEENCQTVFDRFNSILQNISKEEISFLFSNLDYSNNEIFDTLTTHQKTQLFNRFNGTNFSLQIIGVEGVELFEGGEYSTIEDLNGTEVISSDSIEIMGNKLKINFENRITNAGLRQKDVRIIFERGKTYKVRFDYDLTNFDSDIQFTIGFRNNFNRIIHSIHIDNINDRTGFMSRNFIAQENGYFLLSLIKKTEGLGYALIDNISIKEITNTII